MTLRMNARIAGYAFLIYLVATVAGVALFAEATRGEGITAQLANIARHATLIRLTVLLGLVAGFCALVLAVTLYAITREQNRDLAMLALTCRVAEGVIGVDMSRTLGVLWLATSADAASLDAGSASAIGAFFLKTGSLFNASAIFFAAGSTLFSWLLLRGRMIPAALAWFGVLASIYPLVCYPLELVGVLSGAVTASIWLPIVLFEVVLAFWLIIKGVTEKTDTNPNL